MVSLPPSAQLFKVKFSECLEDLEAADLCRLIESCGPKTELELDISEKMFEKIIARSPNFEDYMLL